MAFTKPNFKDSLRGLVGKEDLLLLNEVSNFLGERNIESYVVGGFVRDVLLRRNTDDIDIAVKTDVLEIAPKIAAALGGKYVLLDKLNKVGRVVLTGGGYLSPASKRELDFSTFTGSIEQDLERRDFTVDSMAISLEQFGKNDTDIQLIDPFNGKNDIIDGKIRVLAEEAFTSDALRLLRAVRLAAELDFSIDEKTEALIQHHSNLLTGVSGERVREELLKLLALSGERQFLTYLDKLGLLTVLFPELGDTKGIEQPVEHFWNVFEHSINAVVAVDFLLRRGTWEYANEAVLDVVPWSEVLSKHFSKEVSRGSDRRVLLKLATLLHDIRKPQTKAIQANGKTRFLGHAEKGANIVTGMLERLRFSSKEIKLVEIEVKYHLRPGQMSNNDEIPTHRAIYRYFRDTGEAGLDILFLSLADHLATRGPNLDLAGWKRHAQKVGYVIGQHFEKKNIIKPPKLVDGYDIINIFGMSAGPEVGEVLEAVREAQASGEVSSRDEALSLASKLLSSLRIEIEESKQIQKDE